MNDPIVAALEALRKFGRHESWCATNLATSSIEETVMSGQCNCGFSQAYFDIEKTTGSGWVSANILPKESGWHAVADSGRAGICRWIKEHKSWRFASKSENFHFTHWRPLSLPDAPKEPS